MTHTVIFMFILAMCVTFLIGAFRAEDRAWQAEQKYERLRASLAQLELELIPRSKEDDPEFLAGWNLAVGHIKTMVRRSENMRDLKADSEQIQNFRSKWRQSTSLEEAWDIGVAWEYFCREKAELWAELWLDQALAEKERADKAEALARELVAALQRDK